MFDPLPEEDALTQFGSTDYFKRKLPANTPDQGLSLTWGRMSVAAMLIAVGRMPPRLRPKDRVRYTTVHALQAAGFDVRHNPRHRNIFHATVKHPPPWDDEVAESFDSCFDGVGDT